LDSEIERHKSEKTNLVKTRKDWEKYVQKNDIKTLHKKTYKNRKEAVTGLIWDKYKNILHKYKQSIISTFQEEFREYGYDPIISNKWM
jgi:chromatin segregation and condensation protein Rec8/ScpA/Scc1 (kleisin family)